MKEIRERERRIATGKGRFIEDVELPNMAYCIFIGSPYAHAKIKNIDSSKALKTPGVLTVITGKELVYLTEPLPAISDLRAAGWNWRIPKIYPLAFDKVRFHGEPVAAVVAEHPYIAHEAADLIEIDYEPLPAVTDVNEAMRTGSPLLYEEWGDNIQAYKELDLGDVDAAFKEADRILDVSWREGRASGFPIEARGCITWYDKMTEELTTWGSYQSPFRSQQYLSHILRIPPTRVKVIAVDIGGAFGNKIHSWKHSVVGLAAILSGRPVKWVESKREFIASGPHQRDVKWEGKVAIKNDGRVLGIKAKYIQDLGVDVSCRGYAGPSLIAACFSVPNAYRLKGLMIEAYGVVTNKSFYGAYRGYGKDKGIKFMERIIDLVAKECDIIPEEVRLRNFIQPNEFPYKHISGYVYDSGDYPAVLKKSLKLAEIDLWRSRQEELQKQGKYVGIGMAFVVEPAGVATANAASGLVQARIRLMPDGMVEVYSDRTEIGQGAEASHRIVTSDILGVKMDDVVVKPVTSDMVGMGPVSSRGSVYSLSAVAVAAKQLRAKLKKLASAFLKEDTENIMFGDGLIYSTTYPERKLTYRELAKRVYFLPGPRGLPRELQLEHDFLPDVTTTWFSPNTSQNPTSTYTTFCCEADIAVVEVDIETGITKILKYVHVHDAGKIISKDIVEGQIHGGVVQGIGEALLEELVYSENKELLSTSYTDYLLPTALDSPDIVIGHLETLSPFTELGTKGMGEAPIIGGKAVIISAIEDALSPLKIRITESPATSERVRRWVLEAQRS